MFIGPKPEGVVEPDSAERVSTSALAGPPCPTAVSGEQSGILFALAKLRAERELRGFLARGGKLN